MKINKNDFLKHSYVIYVDENRLNIFNDKMKSIDFCNIKSQIGRLDTDDGTRNCGFTHCDIVRFAKRNNFDYITIFEDDADPIKNFNYELDIALNNIPDDASIVLLGYTHCNSIENFNKKNEYDYLVNKKTIYVNQKELHKCWGAQCYIIFKKDYDRFIDIVPKYKKGHVQTDIDACLHVNNPYFYVKRIPIFLQTNVGNCIHGTESNKHCDMLRKIYNI